MIIKPGVSLNAESGMSLVYNKPMAENRQKQMDERNQERLKRYCKRWAEHQCGYKPKLELWT